MACSACFLIQLRPLCLGVALLTGNWALPYVSGIKRLMHRLAYRPVFVGNSSKLKK